MSPKKKQPKVEPIPRDVIAKALAKPGFMYVPRPDVKVPTACPGCERGTVVWVGSATNYSFHCSARCGWECASEERLKVYRAECKAKQAKAKKKPKAKKPKNTVISTKEFQAAFRKEHERRLKALLAERAKFPPTFTKAGKPNKKFTNEMREHLHKFSFTHEMIVKDLLKG